MLNIRKFVNKVNNKHSRLINKYYFLLGHTALEINNKRHNKFIIAYLLIVLSKLCTIS